DAHQTAELEARQLQHAARQRRELRLGDSTLAGLIFETHLNADVDRRCVRTALLAETHGDALAIERVYPVKVLSDDARLVGLELADVMPGQRQVAELVELRQRFLHVVLAEVLLTELGQRADRSGGARLRGGDEAHRTGVAITP